MQAAAPSRSRPRPRSPAATREEAECPPGSSCARAARRSLRRSSSSLKALPRTRRALEFHHRKCTRVQCRACGCRRARSECLRAAPPGPTEAVAVPARGTPAAGREALGGASRREQAARRRACPGPGHWAWRAAAGGQGSVTMAAAWWFRSDWASGERAAGATASCLATRAATRPPHSHILLLNSSSDFQF